jgi:hypothetical protein
MNSRNQPDDLLDLSLRHSLKNWATHSEPPSDGRDRLLATLGEELATPKRKKSFFNFGWTFRFPRNQEVLDFRPVYGYTLDSLYSLKANMAIL